MSKTVMIPSTQGNPWVCSVNNTKYSYEAGTEQTVPDEVAAIIGSADDFPPAAPAVDAPFNAGGGGGWPADLPKPSVGGYGYTEQGEQVLYDGNLLINTPISDSGTVYNIIDTDPLEVGETYKVVWNGVEYICECVGGEVTYIGNASIIGAPVETDEPFVFAVDEGAVLVATSTAGTYSIKLSKNGETVHKIDEKYLPEGGGIFEIFYNSGTETVDKTYAEIKQAYYAGKNVTLRMSGDVILQIISMTMSDDDSDIGFSGLSNIYIDPDTAELRTANIHQVTIASDESVAYQQGHFGF